GVVILNRIERGCKRLGGAEHCEGDEQDCGFSHGAAGELKFLSARCQPFNLSAARLSQVTATAENGGTSSYSNNHAGIGWRRRSSRAPAMETEGSYAARTDHDRREQTGVTPKLHW